MPLIDVLRTTFTVTFSPDEDSLKRNVKRMIREVNGDVDSLVETNKVNKLGYGFVKFPATLEVVRLLKRMYKDKHAYILTDKYKTFAMRLHNNEKSFIENSKLFETIKRFNPDNIGHNLDNIFYIDDYRFKTKPWNHQKIGFMLMKHCRSIMLNWDMRTGKTFMVSNYMQYLKQSTNFKITLVLAPMDILESTWIRDVYEHTGLEGLAVIDALNAKRIITLKRNNITMPLKDGSYQEFRGCPDYYAMNHDSCKNPKVLDYILKVMKPDNLVIDEYHKFKTPSANRTKKAIKISQYIHSKNGAVVLMSGTGFTKDIRDGYAPSVLVDPSLFPYSFAEYKRRFCIIEGGYNDHTKECKTSIYRGNKNEDIFRERYLQRSHRVLIQDCHEMPKKIESIRYVNMTNEQKRHHSNLSSRLMTDLPKNKGTLTVTALTKLIKLVQVTGGYIYDNDREYHLLKKNPKLIELQNILDQVLSNEKNNVVIYTNFRPPVLIIRKFLQSLEWKFEEMTTQSKTRKTSEWDFTNDKDCRIMLAQPALCEGKDFSKANYAIFFDNNYKMIEREQADRRIFTPKSLKHGSVVTIDLVCRHSIDEVILASLKEKKEFNTNITSEKVFTSSLTPEYVNKIFAGR